MGERQLQLVHIDLPTLAKSLKLTSIDVIKTTNLDIESHWFRSMGQADLYFWKAKDRIVKQQISIYNQIVEWNEFDGVKTGYVNEDAYGQGEVICFDEELNESVVQQAIEFLNNVDQIQPDTLNVLISHYKFYNRWRNLPFLASLSRIFRLFFRKT